VEEIIMQRKMVFLVAVVVLSASLLAGCALPYHEAKSTGGADYRPLVVSLIAQQIDTFLQERGDDVAQFAQINDLARQDGATQIALLRDFFASNEYFDEIALLDAEGAVLTQLSRREVGPLPDNLYGLEDFAEALETGSVYYGSVRINVATGEPLMPVIVPLYDLASGTITHAVIAELRFFFVWDYIAALPFDQFPEMDVYVVNAATQQVIVHQNPTIVMTGTVADLPATDGRAYGISDELRDILMSRISLGAQEMIVVLEISVD
jgi:hypothetical protein